MGIEDVVAIHQRLAACLAVRESRSLPTYWKGRFPRWAAGQDLEGLLK